MEELTKVSLLLGYQLFKVSLKLLCVRADVYWAVPKRCPYL